MAGAGRRGISHGLGALLATLLLCAPAWAPPAAHAEPSTPLVEAAPGAGIGSEVSTPALEPPGIEAGPESAPNCGSGARPSECPYWKTPTIFVHGYSPEIPTAEDPKCPEAWSTMESHLRTLAERQGHKWEAPMITVGYYAGDSECDVKLDQEAYEPPLWCVYCHAQNNNTAIAVFGYELRKYIVSTFGSAPVNIVAHSMGGLVVRSMFTTGFYEGTGGECIPARICAHEEHIQIRFSELPEPRVGHVVTLGTPHEGTDGLVDAVGFGWEGQQELPGGSSFLGWLGAQAFRGPDSATWTAIAVGGTGSGDGIISERSAGVTDGGAGSFDPDNRVVYWQGQNYNHLNENTGTNTGDGRPSDSGCEADASSSNAEASCFDAKYSQGGSLALHEHNNGTFPGIRETTLYGLMGQLPPIGEQPHISGVGLASPNYGLVGGEANVMTIEGQKLGEYRSGANGPAYQVQVTDGATRARASCREAEGTLGEVLSDNHELYCVLPPETALSSATDATVQVLSGDGASNLFTLPVEGALPAAVPHISSVSPATAGTGQQVTVGGSAFGAQRFASSYLDLRNCTSAGVCSHWGLGEDPAPGVKPLTIDSWSEGQVTFTVPAGVAQGTAGELTLHTYRGTSNGYDLVISAPLPGAPTVTSVSPSFGSTGGGTPVTISGTNLANVSSVRFGSTSASSYKVASPTAIEAVTPAHSEGTVDVTVTTLSGTSATSGADRFSYFPPVPPPTQEDVFVGLHDLLHGYEGPESTFTGANAWNYTSCSAGNWHGFTTAMRGGAWVSEADHSEAWAAGVGTTTSTMWWDAGTGILQPNTNYAIFADIDTCNAGTTSAWYTIAGNDGEVGFHSGDTGQKNVSLNQSAVNGYVYLGTENAGWGGITVALVNGGANHTVGAADIELVPTSAVPAPSVGWLSPTSGEAGGGNSVTINGTNLEGATAVYFGSARATITSDTWGAVTAKAPAGSGTVDVTVTTAGGTSLRSSADHYTYINPNPSKPKGLFVGLRDSYGSTGGPQVTLTGEAGLWHKTTCTAGGWAGVDETLESSSGLWSALGDSTEWWAYGKASPSTTTLWWTAGQGILSPSAEYNIYVDVDSCNAATSAAWYTIAGEDGETSFSRASGVTTVKVDQETATGYVYLGTEPTGSRGVTVALVNGGANKQIGAADIKLERVPPCRSPCPS